MDTKMTRQGTANEYSTILRLLNLKPVSVPPLYKMIVGSYDGAILLSQILYWHSVMGREYYKTNDDFMQELYMSEREFKRAKASIKNVPFIITRRRGVPARTHYDVNYDLMASTLKNVLTSSDGVCPNWMGRHTTQLDGTAYVPTITESTTETTTDITTPSAIASAEELFNQSKKDPVRTDKDVARRDEFSYTEDFTAFWTAYPRHVGKGKAFAEWKRIKGRPPVEEIIQAVRKQQRSEQWTKDGGQFIPHPSTWLHQRRWEDEVDVRKSEKPYGYE